MAKGILGRKVGMTQIFSEDGKVMAVTVVDVQPNVVLQKKTKETDGYEAVQIGYMFAKKENKPQIGHAKKAGTKSCAHVREIKGNEMFCFKPGDMVKADIFKEGDIVDVTGTSKGKGFAGVIKRYHFTRGPMAHGSGYHRGTGSMGSIDPARIKKGHKMPGRMGGERVTALNLQIAKIDLEKNIMLIKGSVPGANKACVMIKSGVKANIPDASERRE